MTILKKIESMKTILAAAEVDARKFEMNGVNVAGTRVRKSMQNMKRIAQEIRERVNEVRAVVKKGK